MAMQFQFNNFKIYKSIDEASKDFPEAPKMIYINSDMTFINMFLFLRNEICTSGGLYNNKRGTDWFSYSPCIICSDELAPGMYARNVDSKNPSSYQAPVSVKGVKESEHLMSELLKLAGVETAKEFRAKWDTLVFQMAWPRPISETPETSNLRMNIQVRLDNEKKTYEQDCTRALEEFVAKNILSVEGVRNSKNYYGSDGYVYYSPVIREDIRIKPVIVKDYSRSFLYGKPDGISISENTVFNRVFTIKPDKLKETLDFIEKTYSEYLTYIKLN